MVCFLVSPKVKLYHETFSLANIFPTVPAAGRSSWLLRRTNLPAGCCLAVQQFGVVCWLYGMMVCPPLSGQGLRSSPPLTALLNNTSQKVRPAKWQPRTQCTPLDNLLSLHSLGLGLATSLGHNFF